MSDLVNTPNLGKLRGLQQCASADGIFCILALDHRQVIKGAFKNSPDPYQLAVQFKCETVRALGPVSTAMLLDPSFGAGPALVNNSLPGSCGLIVALEESGYADQPSARLSRVAEGWSVAKIKRMSASAVKLLVYYHPDSTRAANMRELVISVAEDCRRYDIPLFLEPLSYSVDPTLPKMDLVERRRVILQTAHDLTPLGADILKVEFPVIVEEKPDERLWAEACTELSTASCIPWVLLSAAADYEVFIRQATIACQSGASGILAGRAIWKEALGFIGNERSHFLQTVAVDRMSQLRQVCVSYAQPFTTRLNPLELKEDWYKNYPAF